MTERVWRLRAMSVADLLDETIRLYRHNFLTFVGIAAILQAPMTLLSTFLSAYFAQRYLAELQTSVEGYGALPSDDFMVGYLVYLGLIVLVGLFNLLVINNLITAALARAIANRYLDESVSIGGAYRAILRRFLPLLGALLLLVLINIGLGLMVLIPCVGALAWIPLFVWINVRLIFVTQAVVLEDCSPRQALSRSWDLVQGYGWRTLGVYLLIWLFSLLIVSLPSYIITFGLQAIEIPLVAQTVISGVLSVVLTVLYMPIRLTGMTLLYYDLRIRKEGLDLELQAVALGEGAGEPLGERTARDFLLAGRPSQPSAPTSRPPWPSRPATTTTGATWRRPSRPTGPPSPNSPTTPRCTMTWAWPNTTRATWAARWMPSGGRPTWSPITPRPTTTWPWPTATATTCPPPARRCAPT